MKTFLVLSLSIASLAAPLAHGADILTPSPAPAVAAASATADKLASARQLIQGRQWAQALDELKRVNDSASADWNNLMGYVLRKSPSPDLGSSQRYYDTALRIDPAHRNALEYSGELFLMKGDLARANERLGRLAQVCTAQCEQYIELKGAIERYEANGNRYVAKNNW